MTTAGPPSLITYSAEQARLALLGAPHTRDWTPERRSRALHLLEQLTGRPYGAAHLQVVAALRDLTGTLDPPSGTIVRSSLETLAALLQEEVSHDDP